MNITRPTRFLLRLSGRQYVLSDHHKININDPSIYDAHALFYGIKYEMAKDKKKYLKTTKKSMEDLEIEIKDGTPLLREYVVALNDLAFKYRDLNGTIPEAELLDLLHTKGKELLAKHPILRYKTHFVSMIQPDNPQYDTWDKQLMLHSALQDIVAEQRSTDAYTRNISTPMEQRHHHQLMVHPSGEINLLN